MSYLLDALRKSEQERQQKAPVPGLQSSAVEWENSDDGRTRSPWLLVAVVAIVLNTVLLAVLVWRFGFAERGNDAANAATTTTPPTVAANVAPAMPAVIVVQQPAAQSTMQEPIVVRERQASVPMQTGATRNTGSNNAGLSGSASNSSPSNYAQSNQTQSNYTPSDYTSSNDASSNNTRSSGSSTNRAMTGDAANNSSAASDQPLSAAERNVQKGDAAAEHIGLPSVHALSQDVRRQLPYLAMNSHIYANNAKDSFVMINGASYSPGQLVADGLKLVAVVPEGAVLDIHGTRFLLPALATFSP